MRTSKHQSRGKGRWPQYLCAPNLPSLQSILKDNAIIRADLAPVKVHLLPDRTHIREELAFLTALYQIGTFCIISEKSVIRPPFRRFKGCVRVGLLLA